MLTAVTEVCDNYVCVLQNVKIHLPWQKFSSDKNSVSIFLNIIYSIGLIVPTLSLYL